MSPITVKVFTPGSLNNVLILLGLSKMQALAISISQGKLWVCVDGAKISNDDLLIRQWPIKTISNLGTYFKCCAWVEVFQTIQQVLGKYVSVNMYNSNVHSHLLLKNSWQAFRYTI